jgi:hypothetical protein
MRRPTSSAVQLPRPDDVEMIRHSAIAKAPEAHSSRPTLPKYVPWSYVCSRTRRNQRRSSKRPADRGRSADEEAEDGVEMVGLSAGSQGDGGGRSRGSFCRGEDLKLQGVHKRGCWQDARHSHKRPILGGRETCYRGK